MTLLCVPKYHAAHALAQQHNFGPHCFSACAVSAHTRPQIHSCYAESWSYSVARRCQSAHHFHGARHSDCFHGSCRVSIVDLWWLIDSLCCLRHRKLRCFAAGVRLRHQSHASCWPSPSGRWVDSHSLKFARAPLAPRLDRTWQLESCGVSVFGRMGSNFLFLSGGPLPQRAQMSQSV